MAVTSVYEVWDGRKGGIDEKVSRKYTRSFRVTTDDNNDGPLIVRAASGIPALFDSYVTVNEFDLGAVAKSIDVSQDQDFPNVWMVTVEYDSTLDQVEGDPAEQTENPFDRPAEISWGFTKAMKVIDKDLDGLAILNSAYERFDPPVEIEESRPHLTIVRNEPAFDPSVAVEYQDAINEDAFFGAVPKAAKVLGISSQRQYENGIFFWKTTYEFEFRRELWSFKVLDQGYHTQSGGVVTLIREGRDATPLSSPVLLNGSGGRAVLGPSAAQYLAFNVYKVKNFAALGLP